MHNKHRIFIVDDDAYHLNIMEQILLNQNQTDITLFENGVDCLNALHLKPTIIFLDHHMEIYNGREVLKKIKRYDPDIFVIMVSGQEELQIAVDSLKYGAFDYLRKISNLDEQVKGILRKIEIVQLAIESKQTSLLSRLFK